mgnify:CR=1 FL=1
MHLHQIGFDEKAGFAAAGAAYHQHVFVPRRLGVFGTVGHHEPLGLGENDVVLKLRIDVRGDILGLAPTGRAVFQIFAEFLCVLALDVHDKTNEQGGRNAHAQVDGVEAGQRRPERGGKALHEVQRILNIYKRVGRYAAAVEPKVIKRDQNRVDLIYEIDEGPLAKITKINFIGNKHYSDSDLQGEILSKETRWWRIFSSSENYDPEKSNYDKELLRRFYNNHGYADFRVVSSVAELSPASLS